MKLSIIKQSNNHSNEKVFPSSLCRKLSLFCWLRKKKLKLQLKLQLRHQHQQHLPHQQQRHQQHLPHQQQRHQQHLPHQQHLQNKFPVLLDFFIQETESQVLSLFFMPAVVSWSRIPRSSLVPPSCRFNRSPIYHHNLTTIKVARIVC